MSRLSTVKPRISAAPTRQLAKAGGDEESWGSGRGGRPWRRIRDAILLRDKYTCQACHKVTTGLEVDHIVNVAQGGSDDDANLQSLCTPCHKAKTQRESAEGQGRG